jgi:hypothetical protein
MTRFQCSNSVLKNRLWGTTLFSAIILLGLLAGAAQARPGNNGNGNGNGQGNRPTETVVDTTEIDEDLELPTVNFTSEQQQILLDAIYGNSEYADLINPEMRVEILSNRYSLPPWIQQRLDRGGTLPPGIAKKVYLPPTLYTLVDLPVGTEILVIGPNIVTVDSTTDRILNLLENLLLD